MKNSLLFFILLLNASLHAQSVIHEGKLYGLVDSSGKTLLPTAYDEITNFIQFEKPTPYYICKSEGKFGLYCISDRTATAPIYDAMYAQYNMLYLKLGNMVGFLSQSGNTYKIIDPQYEYVFPMCENPHISPDPIWSLDSYSISVKKDSLWGVLSFADGHEVLPLKYKHEVTRCYSNALWVSQDGPNGTEIIINPVTGAEFFTKWMCKRELNTDHTFLLCYYYYGITELHYHVDVWDFATGKVMWTYESLANDLTAHFVNETTVLVEESFDATSELIDNGKKLYSFYNVTNSALLLKHEDKSESQIDVDPEDNKLKVYVRPAYNGKKKFIGEIFR